MKKLINLTVNNEDHEVWTSPHKTLLEVLREDLQLTGTKHGCELGECGACTVIIDGEPLLSCLVLPSEVEGCQIETVEGLAQHGKPHPLQKSFVEMGAAQCGYCTPGMLMSAKRSLRVKMIWTPENRVKHFRGIFAVAPVMRKSSKR